MLFLCTVLQLLQEREKAFRVWLKNAVDCSQHRKDLQNMQKWHMDMDMKRTSIERSQCQENILADDRIIVYVWS